MKKMLSQHLYRLSLCLFLILYSTSSAFAQSSLEPGDVDCSILPPYAEDVSRCGSGSVTLYASPGSGGNTCKWYNSYGQYITTGTSYTTPSLSQTTQYVISTYDTNTGCESSKGVVYAVIKSIPSAPPTPSVSTNTCSNKTLTRGTPPSGVTYYWQGTNSNGYSTTNYNEKFTVTTSGTYYIRARSNAGCWSASTGVSVTVNPIPAAPPAPSVSTNTCGNKTLTRGTPPSGVTYYWQGTNSNGYSTTNYNEKFTVTTSGTYYIRARSNAGCWSTGSASISVTVNQLPATPSTPNVSTGCGDKTLTRETPPLGVTYYWQGTNATGTSTTNYESTYTVSTSGTYYLRARNNSTGCWSSFSAAVSVTIDATPPNPPTLQSTASRIGNGYVTVSVSGTPTGGSYKLYTVSSGGTAIQTSSTGSFSVSVKAPTTTESTTYTYYASTITSGGCESSNRVSIPITVYKAPVISSAEGNKLYLNKPLQLTSAAAFDSYAWRKNGTAISGATSSSYTVTEAGSYSVTVTKSGAGSYTTQGYTVTNGSASDQQDLNYIISNSLLQEGITDPAQIESLNINQLTQTIQYFDGLGRPMQTVSTQASPQKKDLVQPIVYDAYGREAVKFLPYVSSQVNGFYKLNATGTNDPVGQSATYQQSEHYRFYAPSSTVEKIAKDVNPFALTQFEPSPLNRVVEQGAPGAAWQPNADRSVKHDRTIEIALRTNSWDVDKVRLWEYILAANAPESFGTIESDSWYGTGQLYISETTDEHGKRVLEYKDKLGQVVLKEVEGVDENNNAAWLRTYYIYDDFGNLRAVLPPLFSKVFSTDTAPSSHTYTATSLHELCFWYHYDGRKRMVEKHVPGAGVVSMVYDHWDRLVLTQDAEQYSVGQWLYTKYDQLNRPILTGFWQDGRSRKDVQQALSDASKAGTVARFEVRDQAQAHGYTLSSSFPTQAAADEVLSATYYDDYSFKFKAEDTAGKYNFAARTGFPATTSNRVIGQVTGSKVRILGSSDYLQTVSYYDEKYRPIQVVADNQLGGTDRSTTLYNFPGWALKSLHEHRVGDKVTATLTENIYDHAGRLMDSWQTLAVNGHAVSWIDPVGVRVEENKLTKVADAGWGNGGAASKEQLAANADGWIEWTINSSPPRYMVGLARTNPDASYTSIDYAVYIEGGTYQYLKIYERGSMKGTFGSWTIGDVIRIERAGGSVRYSKNGQVFYTSALKVSDALLADVSFYTTQTYLDALKASFADDAQPAVLLARHEYNDLGELVAKKLHGARVQPLPQQPLWKDVISGEFTSGNSFTKAGVVGWNSGFVSADKLAPGQSGWVSVTASERNTARMVGLSAANLNPSYTSINYAWYLTTSGSLLVYESGTNKGSFGTYQTGDVLKVERLGEQVLYKKNDQLIYTSTVASNTELMMDASLYTVGATLSGIEFSFASQDPAIHQLPEPPVYTEAPLASLNFINVVGGSFSGTTFTKTAADGWGNSGFATAEQLADGESGYVEMVAQETTTARMLGLSYSDANQTYTSQTFNWYLYTNGYAYIYERGTHKLTYTTYKAGDVLRVERRGQQIVYTFNGVVAYVSQETSTLPLMVDAALHTTNATMAGLKLVRMQPQQEEVPQQELQFLQTVDMRYNIRGWLSRLNDAALTEATPTDTRWKDLFGFELLYNEVDASLGNLAQFNGNISAMRWSSDWGLNPGEQQRAYKYTYDPLNRISKGDYLSQGTSSSLLASRFSTTYGYDVNGNILNLTRKGATDEGQWGDMDVLSYKYYNGNASNRLQNVHDTGHASQGFKNGSTDTSIDEYLYDANGNMIADKNKGIEEILYNHLNLPELIRFSNGDWISYTYDAAGIKLSQEVTKGQEPVKRTSYVGGMVYVDGQLQFMQHPEGRIVFTQAADSIEAEYQYHLKDHLGNVRLSFSSKPGLTSYLATMEAERAQEEESHFLEFGNTRVPVNLQLDHTHTTPYPTGSSAEVVRLNGYRGVQKGPRKTLRVLPGDTVRAQVWAKYLDLREDGGLSFEAILAALTGATGYTVTTELGGVTKIVFDETGATALLSPLDDQSQPKAFLSWQFVPDSKKAEDGDSGFKGVSAAAAISNTSGVGNHELLQVEYIVRQPGLMNIELDIFAGSTTEDPEVRDIDIYFDDFEVAHHHSPILQSDDYYPFGLTFNSYQREGALENKYKYNGKEEQVELGWLDYGARMYQADLGRFFTQDRFAEKYLDFSPYQYAANNPIKYIDVNGDSIKVYGLWQDGKFDQKAWEIFSKGIHEVTGINLNKPTEEGQALTIAGVDEKVGSKGARQFMSVLLKSDNDKFQLPLHINPDGYDRYAGYDSGITENWQTGKVTEDWSKKKVQMNLNMIQNQITYEGVDKRSFGVGFIFLHEAWHHLGRNDNTKLWPPAGGVEQLINSYRNEMNLPQRLQYQPSKDGTINFGNSKTMSIKGRVILEAYKKE